MSHLCGPVWESNTPAVRCHWSEHRQYSICQRVWSLESQQQLAQPPNLLPSLKWNENVTFMYIRMSTKHITPKKSYIIGGGLVSHRHWGRKRWNENVTFMCIRVSTKHHPKKSYKYLTKIIKHQLKTMISIRIKSFYI